MIEIVTGGLEQGCFEPLYYNTTYRNYGETRLERIEMKGVSNMCDVAQRLEDRGIQIGLEEGRRKCTQIIYSLVEEKSISMEKGAEKLEISVEKLKDDMTKTGYNV
jgi:predicted HTH domain antitoxin